MKVKDLLKVLKKQDKEKEVVICINEGIFGEIEDFGHTEDTIFLETFVDFEEYFDEDLCCCGISPEAMEKVGQDFGYPKCCIDSFIEHAQDGKEKEEIRVETSKLDGEFTGFIPCLAHAKQIRDGEIFLTSLIQNRTHPLPFPIQDQKTTDSIVEEYGGCTCD